MVLALAASLHCTPAPEIAPDPSPAPPSQARESGAGSGSPPLVRVSDGRYLMGTVLDLTLLGTDEAELRAALAWSFERVEALEQVASRHRPDSELSRFNARAVGAPPTRVSADLRELLARSREAGARTSGAFDVTVAPLLELWRHAAERDRWPGEAVIEEARARVGHEAIRIDSDGGAWLAGAGRGIDFGGIAKGYALDVVKSELERRGIRRGLLDFGGSSVWAMGQAPGGGPWRLEIDARQARGPTRVVELVDRALSVSSSFGESSIIEGRRIGHVIDPRSGRPVQTSRTAVVVGRSATDAEVWSTALMVLSPIEGIELVTRLGSVDAWLLTESGETRATDRFDAYLGEGGGASASGP